MAKGCCRSARSRARFGTITLELITTHRTLFTSPIYNMEVTSFGTTAILGYKTALFNGYIVVSVRPDDLGLTSHTFNIPKTGEVHKVSVVLWGEPAAHEHDFERGMVCGGDGEYPPVCRNEFGSPQEANYPVRPFLSNPTSCGMFQARMEADSWEEPLVWTKATDEVGPIVECERVQFEPEIEAQPSTRAVESPTGLSVTLGVPQTWENQFTIATSYLKSTQVTLPEGMTANPGLAEGLAACTPEEYARETSGSPPGEGCPAESKIGSITIETPLLNETIPGSVYIATPYDNVPAFGDSEHPGGSLLALYVVGKDPQKGILLRVAGKIEPNPVTGQLVTTFEQQPSLNGEPGAQGLPQQPFSRFTLKFRPGAAAPLISPPTCGGYSVTGSLTPWSAPLEPRVAAGQPFQLTEWIDGAACPPGGVPPFNPRVISGTQNNAGGTYSPFYLRLLRQDGEQELIHFSTTLPPGLTGNLTGVEKCPDADIEAARTVTGAEEEERPSCPAGSEIGHTLVGAGVGSVLAENPGKLYLAGPYHGAPLSVVSITAAKVGPFDLGTVVIRFALDIDHTTAQVELSGAQSDPIPHIIKGIVVHVRDIRAYIDRPNFILNPTNCEALNLTDAVTGSGSNYAVATGEDTVNVATRFEAADCASLQFAPQFSVSTSAKTSRLDGASLSVRLSQKPEGPGGKDANFKQVKVELPRQLPSRLPTLQKACTKAQFDANPAGCPPASIVGHAKAITPILPVPLEGPAYFVSNGGEAFPNLIIVLQGYGFTIDLVGDTFISKAGVTSSTFKAIPDQPVTSFELTLPDGPYSALTALGNLCTTKNLTMPTELVGQNGAEIKQSTKIAVTGCPKARHAKHKRRKHASRRHAKKGKKK